MISYKVKDEVLQRMCELLNELLILGCTPGYCMDIIRGNHTATHILEIYDTGDYNFRVRVVESIPYKYNHDAANNS